MAKLTIRQTKFVTEYLASKNATKAAKVAGYSPKTAYSQGQRLLKKVEIKAAIDEQIKAQSTRTLITADYVLTSLKEVADRCMQKVPVMYFDKETKSYEQKTDAEGEGIWEFDSAGANKALELLGKHLKLFDDKLIDPAIEKAMETMGTVVKDAINALNKRKN